MNTTGQQSENGDPTMEEAILAAAERLFLQKGFAQTSTTEIARQVGCNQALIHYYFRTKEQLFIRIFQEKIRFFLARLMGVYDQGIPFEEKITRMVDAHFDILLENPRLPALIINEIAANPERIKELKTSVGHLPAGFFVRLEADLQAEVAAGRVRPMAAFDLMLDILSLDALPFLVSPILKGALELTDSQFAVAMDHRREAVKKTLINSLRP